MVINIEGGGGGGDQEIHGLDRAHNRLLFTAWRAVAGQPGPWLCPGGGMKKLGGTYNQYRQDNGLVITKDGASWLTSDPLCDTSPQEWRPVRMFLSYLPAAPPRVPSTLPPTPLIAMNRPLSPSQDYIVVTTDPLVGGETFFAVFQLPDLGSHLGPSTFSGEQYLHPCEGQTPAPRLLSQCPRNRSTLLA